MKRGIHIVLACLLVLQPLMPLWAAAGPDCEMAAMHGGDQHPTAPCEHCADCGGESDCSSLCQAVFSSPIALFHAATVGRLVSAHHFNPTASDQVPAGHWRPAHRPPISV